MPLSHMACARYTCPEMETNKQEITQTMQNDSRKAYQPVKHGMLRPVRLTSIGLGRARIWCKWGEHRFIIPERDELAQYGFTADEIVSLLWLRQWYQNGGSDRVEVPRHWEFLTLRVKSGEWDLGGDAMETTII